jgi:hypothetical protein
MVMVKCRILVVCKNKEYEILIGFFNIYLNIADVSSSPHHATLILTDRERDGCFAFQRNLGI